MPGRSSSVFFTDHWKEKATSNTAALIIESPSRPALQTADPDTSIMTRLTSADVNCYQVKLQIC